MRNVLPRGVLVELEKSLVTIDGIMVVRGTVMRVSHESDRYLVLGCPGLESVCYVFRKPVDAAGFHVLQCP